MKVSNEVSIKISRIFSHIQLIYIVISTEPRELVLLFDIAAIDTLSLLDLFVSKFDHVKVRCFRFVELSQLKHCIVVVFVVSVY